MSNYKLEEGKSEAIMCSQNAWIILPAAVDELLYEILNPKVSQKYI